MSFSPRPVRLIIYDLDGTLIDSFEDIRRALNRALQRCDLPTHSIERVKSYVGDGVAALVERAIGPDQSHRRDEVIALLVADYGERPGDATKLYPNVIETLDAVRARGVNQAVLTNKPHEIAVKSCDLLGIASRIDAVQGASPDLPLKPDPESVRPLLKEFGVTPEEAVIVGDGKPDGALARAVGIRFIGCAWGVGTREELEALGADAVIDEMSELVPLLFG